MGKKALFFDVDGTLLSEETHQVPESAIRAIAKSRESGNLVFINSGRTWSFLGEIRDMIEVDGFLCGCGTCVVEQDKVIYQKSIPVPRGIELRKNFLRFGYDVVLEGTQGLYCRPELSHIPELRGLQERQGSDGVIDYDHWEDPELVFDKFCMFGDENSDRDGMFAFLEPDLEVIGRGRQFFEVVPKGCTKATAIQWVLEHYGIDKKDAYVFGDSSNDLAMFEFADNAILMEVHDAVLEPYATFVTKKVEEDGIAYAMEQLGLC
jgi:Cof subfamily protein (haloacid dehalogenase superfamily)